MGDFEGTNFIDFKNELLKDERELQTYLELKPKYDMIQRFIERRNELRLTQRELAERVGMKQSSIARLESGGINTRVGTLFRIADALQLDVEFKPRHLAGCK